MVCKASKPSPVPLEQLTQFVQQAITNHERGLDRVLESVAPEEFEPAPVKVRELLTDLVRFLSTDAARNRVRLKVDMGDDVVARVALARLQLIFIGLLTHGIDALTNGGDIAITAELVDSQVQIDLVDPRTEDDPDAFVTRAIAEIVAHSSGSIERTRVERGYRVRLRLPRYN
jgi:LytS/YehU family sensor histidine kinase